MANDFLKKQPTKNEKMFYDLMMGMDTLDRRMWTTSSFVTALALLLKVEPKKVAELLTGEQTEIREFSKQINDEIDKIEAARKPADGEDSHAGHNHPHDHSHEGHDHGHNHDHAGHDHEHHDHSHAEAV